MNNNKLKNHEDICYHEKEKILDLLRKRGCTESLTAFFHNSDSFKKDEADYASSLILLKASNECKIHAELKTSPNLKDLPPIKRTGTSPPWMRGYLLGFETDKITDADLQRARSLFLTQQAAIEEWYNLLFRIFKILMIYPEFPKDEIQELGEAIGITNKICFKKLSDVLSEWHRIIINRSTESYSKIEKDPQLSKISDKINEMFSSIEKELNRNEVRIYSNKQFDILSNEIQQLSAQDFDIPDHSLFRNLIIALLLALDEDCYNNRHLGYPRLKSISEKKAEKGVKRYNLIIQGAGDLSMNPWNIAFYYENKKKGDNEKEPRTFFPENEPFASREYDCLLVWKKEKEKRKKVEYAIEKISGSKEKIGICLGTDLAIIKLRILPGKPYIKLPDRLFNEDDLRNLPREEKGEKENLLNEIKYQLYKYIDFALYGKLILRNGKIVEPVEKIDEFQDLRHIFKLPNLNPEDQYIDEFLKKTKRVLDKWIETPVNKNGQFQHIVSDYEGMIKYYEKLKTKLKTNKENIILSRLYKDFEKWPMLELMRIAEKIWQWAVSGNAPEDIKEKQGELEEQLDETQRFLISHFSNLRLHTPRYIFGEAEKTPFWLFEYALLNDSSLRHLACTSPISVSLGDLGAPRSWIHFCLLNEGYQEKRNLADVRETGDFAWDESEHPRLFVRLKLNSYPCTIVGIGSPEDSMNDTLYLMSWGHDFNRGNRTIWECAEILKDAGVQYALVIDEGQDVFQFHIHGDISLAYHRFQSKEGNCEPLDDWMHVPIAFDEKNKTLKRRCLRASLAFWQEKRESRMDRM